MTQAAPGGRKHDKSRRRLGPRCCWYWRAAALAQSGYPDKPIRILVGFSAGVAPDVTSRLFGDKWNETWAKGVAVENVTGAGGNLAVAQVAKAAPDGYTLAMGGNAALVINPNLMDRLGYDPVKDFAYITQVFIVPNLVVVPPDFPAKDIKELIALAKAKPDYLVAGHAGIGTSQHLGGELFMKMAASRSSRCRTAAPRRSCPTCWADASIFSSATSPTFCRWFARASCAPSPSPRASVRRKSPSCRPWRSWASRLRSHRLVRAAGAGRHAEADRRQDSRRDREGDGAAGCAPEARSARPSARRQHAGGIPRPREDGNADVGQGHQGRRHQGGAIAAQPKREGA